MESRYLRGVPNIPRNCCIVLMDMPGQYPQPQLRSRLLEYVRSVVREEDEKIQFIIVTNSSDLIDKAIAEELFMLMPSQQLAEGCNQLVKVSNANMCTMRVPA